MRVQKVLIAFVALLLMTGCSLNPLQHDHADDGHDGHSHGSAKSTTAGGNAPRRALRGSDVLDMQFIDMMVPHHEGALEMAKIARQRAERLEIKQLSRSILADQHHEIQQMKTWRRQWFGSSETPTMDKMPMVDGMTTSHGHTGNVTHDKHETMDMAADVEALRKATGPFDREFIDAMIVHHESAVEAAKAVLDRTERPQIRYLAQAVIADQSREIDQMKKWRTAWYGSAQAGR